MHKALRVVRVFRLFIVILILLSPLSAYAGPASRVLVIHSYHADFPWTEAIHTGIQHGFGASETEHDLFIEYLDAKRFAPQEFSSDFARYLASKYQDSRIDLLIVSDDNALRFALDYRDTLFRGVPIVFCGIINFDTYENQLPSGITGIAEDIDLASNLSLISRLHGIGTTVAAVADYTVSGSENTRRFLDLINNPQSPRLRYEVFFGYDSVELTSRLNRLPENAVILNLGFWRDRTGSDFNYRESISLLTGTGLPVYSAWDQAIRFGAVGGIVLDVEHQGTAAAEIALRILSGTAPDDIPVIREPQIKPVFNYQALKTHKIQMHRLPAGSSIINKPDTIYFRYPVVFSTIIAALGLLLLLVVLLGINIVQRKQAESLFYSLFHNAPDVIMLFSPRREYTHRQ
ncbi:ABC transporter substrate binding protein [Marispirochaeta sp.]|uniref:ABC transporter substrate-binding protein n=1 Tax=Marispirochaeta sp. TaxID=2038653 RepID=UPI0029C6B274|nr:ABC transporter substrate binding protein [Marispirochaeta sp.]